MTTQSGTEEQISEGPLLWAAGILEANGAFYLTASRTNVVRGRIQCRLADPDVLERLREALGAGRVNGPYEAAAGSMGRKLSWVFQINQKADVVRIAQQLKRHMGNRRQSQIAEMLAAMGAS